MSKKKKKNQKRIFKADAVLSFDNKNGIEVMFNSSLSWVTVRAVVNGEIKEPYHKSEVFYDEATQEPYFVIAVEQRGEELVYVKFPLSDFTRV